MKKFTLVLVFILGFFAVFAISGLVTFMVTLDRDNVAEDATDAVYVGGSILPESDVIEDNTTVTRVTPSLRVEDAIIVYGMYGEKQAEEEDAFEMPELTAEDIDTAADVEAFENNEAEEEKVEKKAEAKKEEKKAEVKTETKAETKAEAKVEAKAETKAETKVEEPKAEEVKVEEPKVEEKAEEPKVEEPEAEEKVEEVKSEEKEDAPVVEETPKAEEKPQLDPNKQYSDTGL